MHHLSDAARCVRSSFLNAFLRFGAQTMATRSQSNPDKPPSPGGDPNQVPDTNIPVPPTANNEIRDKEKSGYGHPGKRDEVPVPEGAPKPHQVF
jgi:hypothetical protein